MAGAVLLLLLSPEKINRAVALLTEHELSRDPKDFSANHLVTEAQGLSGEAKTFAVPYLLSHGVLKVGLAWALLKSQLWAYPPRSRSSPPSGFTRFTGMSFRRRPYGWS